MGWVNEQPERYPPTASGRVSPLRRARSTWSGIIHPLRRALFTHCVGQYLSLPILPLVMQGFSSPSEPLSTSQARVIGRDGGVTICALKMCGEQATQVHDIVSQAGLLAVIRGYHRCPQNVRGTSYTSPTRHRLGGRRLGRSTITRPPPPAPTDVPLRVQQRPPLL